MDVLKRYPKATVLREGTRVVVRPLARTDTEKLILLFHDVRDEDLRVLKDNVRDPAVVREWTRTLNFERVLPLVAEIDDQIVGNASIHRRPVAPYDRVGQVRLFTRDDFRRRGLGGILLNELTTISRALGLERLVLEIFVDKADLIAAFERRGFQREAILPVYQMVVLSYDLTRGTDLDLPANGIAHADSLPPLRLWPSRPSRLAEFRQYGETINLSESLLDSTVNQIGSERPALHVGDQTISYGRLLSESQRLASSLNRLGLRPADPVLLHLPNIPQAIAGNFAIQRLGGISVPTAPELTANELAFIARDSEACAAITTVDGLPKVLAARQGCDFGPIVVVGGETDNRQGLYSYAECVARGDSTFAPVRRSRHEVALLLYTARVEGRPKGTAHLLDAPLTVADSFGRYVLRINEDDVLAGTLSLGFVQGVLTAGILPFRFGASALLLPDFTPEGVLAALDRHKATILILTPTTYRQLLGSPPITTARSGLASVRLCVSGGEPLTRVTYDEWEQRTGLSIFEGFGTTEMLGTFLSTAVEMRPRPGSLGRPVPGYEAKVVDDHGRELRNGDIGHLIVRGPTGTLYWNDPEAQARAVKDGWNRTGDYAYCDSDGYFWFVARQDDIIKSGGYRIDPAEVEFALREHPAIADTAVIGMPDDLLGQAVHAILVPVTGSPGDDRLVTSVLESLHGRLASYKIPTQVSFAEVLPRDGSGQLLRRMLREQLRRSLSEESPR